MFRIVCGDVEAFTNNTVSFIPLAYAQLHKYKKDVTVYDTSYLPELTILTLKFGVLRTLLCKNK